MTVSSATAPDLCFDAELRRVLGIRLASFERRRMGLEDHRHAVVNLAVVPDGHEPSEDRDLPAQQRRAAVVLTRRASHLRRHSGQFALPGGRVDPGETPAEAGLRELDEEVGLRLAPERILGWLDDFVTRSGFVISPLVLWAGAGELKPDPEEVAAVYRVPLADCGRSGALVKVPPVVGVPALSLTSVGTYVFSPTAAILHQFAELAVHGRHTEVAGFRQPLFAWR